MCLVCDIYLLAVASCLVLTRFNTYSKGFSVSDFTCAMSWWGSGVNWFKQKMVQSSALRWAPSGSMSSDKMLDVFCQRCKMTRTHRLRLTARQCLFHLDTGIWGWRLCRYQTRPAGCTGRVCCCWLSWWSREKGNRKKSTVNANILQEQANLVSQCLNFVVNYFWYQLALKML